MIRLSRTLELSHSVLLFHHHRFFNIKNVVFLNPIWQIIHVTTLTHIYLFIYIPTPLHTPKKVFICTGETPWLNGKHTVFGKVTKGMDVVKAISFRGNEMGRPTSKVTIQDCGAL
jgi:hypothetical protein